MNFILNLKTHLWANAFRPFFLGASLHALFSVLLWVLILFSQIKPPAFTNPIAFHSYEMVFGFARAAILGFLFTAAQNWTKTILIRERSLIVLFLLWFLGRMSWIDVDMVSRTAFVADLLCDIVVLYLLVPALTKKGQEHNRVIAISYALFLFYHTLVIGSILNLISPVFVLHWIHISVFLVSIFLVIIAGRILPFFTSVAVAGAQPRRVQSIESFSLYGAFLFIGIESILPWFPILTIAAGILSVCFSFLQMVRWFLWEPWKSQQTPILWILFLSYLWMNLGFLAFGLSHFGFFPISSAFHLLTVGAIGGFIYGMITRVSLGHTGRPIRASVAVVFGYYCITFATIVRVVFPFLDFAQTGYAVSGILWIVAFLIITFKYSNILIGPRADSHRT
ncbi:NnrS family protein [Leptospira barantonii]|uniref:NnrS family protein n=1 Tax=Leptospira barantonii TaxID=2023184 RepID=A0A5F2B4F0_9LEPT|nr:NnrS family protein [Leptospira barantonii]TGM00499.1 NnrS family protein [Leptospira barantonii]